MALRTLVVYIRLAGELILVTSMVVLHSPNNQVQQLHVGERATGGTSRNDTRVSRRGSCSGPIPRKVRQSKREHSDMDLASGGHVLIAAGGRNAATNLAQQSGPRKLTSSILYRMQYFAVGHQCCADCVLLLYVAIPVEYAWAVGRTSQPYKLTFNEVSTSGRFCGIVRLLSQLFVPE